MLSLAGLIGFCDVKAARVSKGFGKNKKYFEGTFIGTVKVRNPMHKDQRFEPLVRKVSH